MTPSGQLTGPAGRSEGQPRGAAVCSWARAKMTLALVGHMEVENNHSYLAQHGPWLFVIEPGVSRTDSPIGVRTRLRSRSEHKAEREVEGEGHPGQVAPGSAGAPP